jgi:hypothetical protein
MLASLLLATSQAPVQADEPEQPVLIPRHRVGHRAKVKDLDTLLAQGGDPLAGNHRLVSDDEILVTGQHSDDPTMVRWAFDVDPKLSALSLMNEGFGAGNLTAVATGNFNGDDLDDYVVLRSVDRHIHMDVGYLKDSKDDVTYSFDTTETVYSGYPLSVATGDFDADGQDEIVMAWLGDGGWANLKVYDPQGSIHPAAKSKLYDEQVANGNLEVATGDFDGDGDDEVVLAWVDLGNWVAAKLYEVDQKGVLSAKAKVHLKGGLFSMAVATGDFDGDAVDEIALSDGLYVRLLQAGDHLDSLTSKGEGVMQCYSEDESYPINRLAAGDLNADAVDDIVGSCHDTSWLQLFVWTSDSSLNLDRHGDWSKSGTFAPVGSLGIGDLNRDLRGEIVLAWAVEEGGQWHRHLHNYLQVFQASTDLGRITAKVQQDLGQTPIGSHLAVDLGDLDGDSVRVGPPTYSRAVEAKQLLAVVNEPPKHLDYINGIQYNVNVTETCAPTQGPPCTYANYENQQQQTTSMSLSSSRDWGFSTKLEAKAAFIENSLEASYGQGFEKTTATFTETTFGHEVKAGADDVIIRTETDYDVWEYPVYSDTTSTIQGYIAVVFPVKLDPQCKKDCQVESTLAHIDGRNPLSFYAPNHENHDLLSYSKDPPGDLGKLIKRGPRFYLDGNTNGFWVEWKDVKDDEEKKTRKQGVKIGAGVEGWGIKAKVEGEYSQKQISTHEVSFETETAIRVLINGIEDKYSYVVDSYVYWSTDDGHLAVDYAAWPVTASPPTWWQNTYDKPDPAFNLPWKYSSSKGYPQLTKEITFDPPSSKAGKQVTITARVRNYSLVGVEADKVKVRFYNGDPDNGGVQIGADQTIVQQLNPMSSHTVKVFFDTTGQDGKTLDIYAVIDPDKQIAEMHDETNLPDNNKAYAQLPVKPAGATTRPINLAIHAEDITVKPEVPTAGATVHISATAQAEGDAFAYVGVEFWDGDPHRGGEFIDGELIPMILAGESATAHIAWDTAGEFGDRDIWVGVDHRAIDEDLYSDNWARTAIHLEPYRRYLPFIFKGR